MSTKLAEIMESATAGVVRAIREGIATGEWSPPWRTTSAGLHHQAENGKAYQGANQLILMIVAMVRGYEGTRWATFKTWQTVGAHVRKGERGTQLVRWGTTYVCPRHGKGAKWCGCREAEARYWASHFYVFHESQADDVPELPAKEGPAWSTTEAAEAVIGASGAKMVTVDPNRAFFAPEPDYVNLPPRESFATAEAFYGTALHELTHWTGHEARLARTYGKAFGDDTYAAEELVAELGATFLAAYFGVTVEPSMGAVNYLANWLKVLDDDPSRLYTAAKHAQAAADWLIARVPALEMVSA